MTETDEPPHELGPATDLEATLANKLGSLRNLEIAIGDTIAARNDTAARQLNRIARQHALEALEAALACAARPPAARTRFAAEDIRHAEQRLGIAPGTFASFFAVNLGHDGPARRTALGDLLVEVRDDLAAAPAQEPLREPPSWLPAVIRIGSAVLVGAAVGAPLAALAVGEPVVVEIVKAGIAVTACAIAGEVTNLAVERWLGPPAPVESPEPLHPQVEPLMPRAEPVTTDLKLGPADLEPDPADLKDVPVENFELPARPHLDEPFDDFEP